jgi:hypothetical protein
LSQKASGLKGQGWGSSNHARPARRPHAAGKLAPIPPRGKVILWPAAGAVRHGQDAQESGAEIRQITIIIVLLVVLFAIIEIITQTNIIADTILLVHDLIVGSAEDEKNYGGTTQPQPLRLATIVIRGNPLPT